MQRASRRRCQPACRLRVDSFTARSDTSGKVTARLTIIGQTYPEAFNVEPLGAGKGATYDALGNPIIRDLIGQNIETEIYPQAHGWNVFVAAPIPTQIDAEFVLQE